jgi:hypothetical protein
VRVHPAVTPPSPAVTPPSPAVPADQHGSGLTPGVTPGMTAGMTPGVTSGMTDRITWVAAVMIRRPATHSLGGHPPSRIRHTATQPHRHTATKQDSHPVRSVTWWLLVAPDENYSRSMRVVSIWTIVWIPCFSSIRSALC